MRRYFCNATIILMSRRAGRSFRLLASWDAVRPPSTTFASGIAAACLACSPSNLPDDLRRNAIVSASVAGGITPPQTLGYGFSVWFAARLNERSKKRMISFSEDQLRRLLHQEGFSFQRPKHTMKGKRDEAAFTKAQKQLKTLKKKRCETMPSSP